MTFPFSITYIIEALHNLYSFKLRTGLALLGIVVGTASVVALISSSELATQHALEQFTNLGTDLFAISAEFKGEGGSGHRPSLTAGQVEAVKKSSSNILLAAPYTLNYLSVTSAAKPISVSVVGATEALPNIMKVEMLAGRSVSDLDKMQYFCVLGNKLAQTLYENLKTTHAAVNDVTGLIGQQIRVGDHYFTVIGIAKPWPENMFMYADLNESILIPIAASFTLNSYTAIHNIVFKLKEGTGNQQMQQLIEEKLRQQAPQLNFFARSAKQLIIGMQAQRKTFTLLLGAIGAISLVVGGIGVMNIMLVSVVERRREIGIRMAVGARRRNIRKMFLIEATVLAVIGGAVGSIVGVLTSFIIATFNQWTFHFYIAPLMTGFVVSVLVGIASGYYPAHRASQLDPIAALRMG